MENADDKVDITCMPMYKDGSYDIVLCSHVLEHVVEDRKAISEIYRILKPDGFAIIMVPLALLLEEDLECDDYNTDDLRWKYYGQNDHVRMYSKPGFKNKLNNAGFKISEFDINYFGEETFNKCGIHHRSVLYIVNK